ncbi:MAG: hypothetical protein M3032_04640, partial [Verrucomicrobiota bacterium]|nr:hypothetical protein [Verrucomicrobiota bacterium]
MPATTFSSPLRPDKTMTIAFAAVALLGFFEIAAVGVHFVGKFRASRKAEQPAVATETNPAVVNAPVAADGSAQNAASPATAPATKSAPSNAALSAAEHLLQEAAALRERGDTTNALARLQDAAQRDPKNANVLAEMAMIYESMQLLDRSNETWRKIQDIGPAAGPLFELAELKLKVGVTPPNVAAAAAGPGFAGVSPLDVGTTRLDRDGIPDGSNFGITEATVTENPDPDAQANLTLRVGVKKRPNTITDHTKVKIQVYFYDTVDDNKVALTDAEVNYEWITPDHDWKKSNPEILAVTYVRMKSGAVSSEAALTEAAAQVTPPSGGKKAMIKKQTADGGNRKYAGYQVRVYYNDQLQDVR